MSCSENPEGREPTIEDVKADAAYLRCARAFEYQVGGGMLIASVIDSTVRHIMSGTHFEFQDLLKHGIMVSGTVLLAKFIFWGEKSRCYHAIQNYLSQTPAYERADVEDVLRAARLNPDDFLPAEEEQDPFGYD